MTVSSTPRKAGPFTGNGSQTAFPFSFKVFTKYDIALTRADTSGVESTLVVDSDYSVSLNANQDSSPGGTVTLTSGLALNYKLTITGNLAFSQTTDLPTGGAYNAQNVEDALDRSVMLNQQLLESQSRALLIPVTVGLGSVQLPVPSANNVIGWNATADALQNFSAGDLGVAVSYAQWRTQRFSGTGAQSAFVLTYDAGVASNIDLRLGGVPQTPDVDFTYSPVTKTITFAAAPFAGTNNIVVRYGQALPQNVVLGDGAVLTSMLAALAVTTAKIADANVTTAKIADANVTPAKLANSGYELGMRNRLINGGFRIAQRGVSFTITGSAGPTFLVDRWFGSQLGDGVNDEIISLIADTEGTSQIALRINQYKASGFDGGNSRLIQIIESDATADLQGQVCTLSFKHACGTGIPFSGSWIVAVRYDTNDSTLNSAAASSTAFESLGTGITNQQFRAGGLATTTYTKSSFSFTVPAGARRIAVVFYGSNATNNAVLDIKEVQLEKGPVATPFEFRPYGFELAQCQRYFATVTCYFTGNATAAGQKCGVPIAWPVTMRAAPTVTGLGALTVVNTTSENFYNATASGVKYEATSAAAGAFYVDGRIAVAAAEV